jgi:hypothetical protein
MRAELDVCAWSGDNRAKIMRRSYWPRCALALLLPLLAACAASADRRFATPEDTVRTLFAAYGLEHVSERAIVARLAEGQRFELLDPEGFRACFADHRGPEHEGMAGYVFGVLVAGKEHLRFRADGERVRVLVGRGGASDPGIVLRHTRDGFKIVLAESVPEDVRRQLLALYDRSRAHAARVGLSE